MFCNLFSNFAYMHTPSIPMFGANPFLFNFAFNPFLNFRPTFYPTYNNYNSINSLFNYKPPTNIFTQKTNQNNIFGRNYAEEFRQKTQNLVSSNFLSLGYNAEKGNRLSNIASKNAVGFKGYCARAVKNDIQQAVLGQYEYGHAYQCADTLSKNPNFKEISTKGLDLEKLPAGCILTYGKGVAGYNKQYGHVEITDGKGNAYSDGKTSNIRQGARVFIPV